MGLCFHRVLSSAALGPTPNQITSLLCHRVSPWPFGASFHQLQSACSKTEHPPRGLLCRCYETVQVGRGGRARSKCSMKARTLHCRREEEESGNQELGPRCPRSKSPGLNWEAGRHQRWPGICTQVGARPVGPCLLPSTSRPPLHIPPLRAQLQPPQGCPPQVPCTVSPPCLPLRAATAKSDELTRCYVLAWLPQKTLSTVWEAWGPGCAAAAKDSGVGSLVPGVAR